MIPHPSVVFLLSYIPYIINFVLPDIDECGNGDVPTLTALTTTSREGNIRDGRCKSLEEVLKDIKDKINHIDIDEEQRKRIYFDYNQHEAAIKAWKAHLVRTVLQGGKASCT